MFDTWEGYGKGGGQDPFSPFAVSHSHGRASLTVPVDSYNAIYCNGDREEEIVPNRVRVRFKKNKTLPNSAP